SPKRVSVSISISSNQVEGSLVTLTCSSDSNPPVENYTWFKEEEASPVGSGQSYRALQSGLYYCEAQNKLGSERSSAVPFIRNGGSVNVYVAAGFFALGALLSAPFWLRCRRQEKKADEGDHQNIGLSAKDDTYAALDPADRKSDDVYHTLAVTLDFQVWVSDQKGIVGTGGIGHVQRMDMGYISRRMLRMELPGRRKRRKPRTRIMDVVREDMQVVGLKEADKDERNSMETDKKRR
ncbi:Fc receptor-like protein 5, partial [Silurus asotus]